MTASARSRSYGIETRAVHAGATPDPTTGARNVPIYQTTSYVFHDVDHAAALFNLEAAATSTRAWAIRRSRPSRSGWRAWRAGSAAVATASGHSAQLLAFFTLMGPGDEFVASSFLYGGSITQFTPHLPASLGGTARSSTRATSRRSGPRITREPGCIFTESLANPGGVVVDLEALARSRTRRAFRWWSTTRSPRRSCGGRSSGARTSSSTR